MTLMADFGGFNDAIVLIFTVLMSIYNTRMFKQAIYAEMPVKIKPQVIQQNALQKKFAVDRPLGA